MTRHLALPLCLLIVAPAARAQDEKIAGRTKAEWLKVLAEDPSPRQRVAAVVALSVITPRDRVTEDAVRGALSDKSERVRLKALDGVAVFVVSDSKGQAASIEAIGRVLVSDAVEDDRAHAQEVARDIKADEHQRKLVPALADALRGDKVPRLRAGAAAVLGRYGPNAKAVVNVMTDCLKDADAGVRAALAESLGRIGDEAKGSIPKLAALLKDSDAGVRLSAAFGLGRIGPEAASAIPELAQA